jgi:hypothetical protein
VSLVKFFFCLLFQIVAHCVWKESREEFVLYFVEDGKEVDFWLFGGRVAEDVGG